MANAPTIPASRSIETHPKILASVSRARMGSYADATALAAASGSVPDLAPVRPDPV